MRASKLVYAIVLILFLVPIVLAQDYDKELAIEDAMKVFCGTWFCVGYDNYFSSKVTYNLDGTYEWYLFKEDTKPYKILNFKIKKAWLDKDGNIWFTVWRSFKDNSWALTNISNAGNRMEYCRYSVTENVPTSLDDIQCDIFRCVKEKN